MKKAVQTFARKKWRKMATVAKAVRPCMALASRELEVARLICDGKYPKEIAQALHVSGKSVSTYMARLTTKLKVQSPVQVALWMLKNGKVTLDELYCGVPECVCDCHCHVVNKDYENPKVKWPSRPVKGGKSC